MINSAGNVYVGDYGNNHVQKFSSTTSQSGALLAQLMVNSTLHSGIAVVSGGNVYIADDSDRIQVFAPDTNIKGNISQKKP